MNIFLPLITGILGAMTHVLSGPDHLAAVTPFAIEEKNKAWKVGVFWGLGHITGMMLIGVLFLIFKELIPVEKISGYSEVLVGIILIGIGIWAIMKATGIKINRNVFHIHFNNYPYLHSHKNHTVNHRHKDEENIPKKVLKNSLSAFYIGTIHGFAGIAHFVLFLPVLGFSSGIEIANYLIGFAIGTILAMMLYALLLGKISHLFHSNSKKVFKYLRLGSGILAIVVGLYWIFAN
ncbi:MAG TPA: hypothetical protein ENK91_03770 [Bacteroidetes bacterium]|nr:hypothetical protein [Bacteroidota bacterium]